MLGRLRELEPPMREYDQLRKAAQRLGVKYKPGTDTGASEQGPPSRRRTTSRSAASSGAGGKAKATAAAKQPTRARKSTNRSRKTTAQRQGAGGRRAAASPGQRQAEVLRLVGENPGIKVSEIGKRLGLDSTGLYRVVRKLTEEGRLRKEGAQLYLAETQTSEPAAPGRVDERRSDAVVAKLAARRASSAAQGAQAAAGAMMKRLYLLRHAKSSWKDPGLPDHDRPLADRGRHAAAAIARHLRAQGIEPELVLCSTARRARETLERIEPALGTPAMRIEPDLYGASAGALLERVRGVADAVDSVMVIGHNPGLQRLAVDLARPAPGLRELEAKYPTAALATLAFPGPKWQALERGTAELAGFVRPRDLTR